MVIFIKNFVLGHITQYYDIDVICRLYIKLTEHFTEIKNIKQIKRLSTKNINMLIYCYNLLFNKLLVIFDNNTSIANVLKLNCIKILENFKEIKNNIFNLVKNIFR